MLFAGLLRWRRFLGFVAFQRLVQVVGGLRHFLVDGGLHLARRLLHRVAHLAQLVELDLAVDVGLHVVHVALQPAGEVADGARHARQLLRPDDDERHHADDQQFRESDVEHALETKKAPRGRLAGSRAAAQALCSLLACTSPSTVLPVTCGVSGPPAVPSRMPSLKPRTAPPRSVPMLRSFFVPKISITITRTMIQCQMLSEPILPSPNACLRRRFLWRGS